MYLWGRWGCTYHHVCWHGFILSDRRFQFLSWAYLTTSVTLSRPTITSGHGLIGHKNTQDRACRCTKKPASIITYFYGKMYVDSGKMSQANNPASTGGAITELKIGVTHKHSIMNTF